MLEWLNAVAMALGYIVMLIFVYICWLRVFGEPHDRQSADQDWRDEMLESMRRDMQRERRRQIEQRLFTGGRVPGDIIDWRDREESEDDVQAGGDEAGDDLDDATMTITDEDGNIMEDGVPVQIRSTFRSEEEGGEDGETEIVSAADFVRSDGTAPVFGWDLGEREAEGQPADQEDEQQPDDPEPEQPSHQDTIDAWVRQNARVRKTRVTVWEQDYREQSDRQLEQRAQELKRDALNTKGEAKAAAEAELAVVEQIREEGDR